MRSLAKILAILLVYCIGIQPTVAHAQTIRVQTGQMNGGAVNAGVAVPKVQLNPGSISAIISFPCPARFPRSRESLPWPRPAFLVRIVPSFPNRPWAQAEGLARAWRFRFPREAPCPRPAFLARAWRFRFPREAPCRSGLRMRLCLPQRCRAGSPRPLKRSPSRARNSKKPRPTRPAGTRSPPSSTRSPESSSSRPSPLRRIPAAPRPPSPARALPSRRPRGRRGRSPRFRPRRPLRRRPRARGSRSSRTRSATPRSGGT